MSIYHTTYDLRRGKDKVNMKNRSHVMTLSRDGTHPYAYACVLGIFSLDVLHGPTMSDEARMDVLWVRWFEIDTTHRAGWKAKRLYRIKYVPALEDGAFGFLDPNDIIRGSHLIGGFNLGHRSHFVRATLSLCEFTSEAMSTLGCRRPTYPRVSSGLPFLPNKPQALVAKRRGGRT